MESPNTAKIDKTQEENEHAETVAFFEKHRDFFEHYAKGAIKVEPAPRGLQTFAFNLETNTVYLNSNLFKKVFGFTEEKTVFATLHEIEHFMEKLQVLSEEGGEKKFEKFLKRIKESKAFDLMDNCVSDIHENRSVIGKTSEGMSELEKKIYKEDLFPEMNFINKPRHIQFCEALLREARVPEEKCEVSTEVRQALDEIAKVKGLINIMTNPDMSMSIRWKLQDKYIWPKVQKLLERDLEEKEKQKKQEQNTESEDKNKPEETNPNKIFAEDYTETDKKFPKAISLEEEEKAFKKWQEVQKEKNNDKTDEEYAKKLGVEKKDLQEYRRIVNQLNAMINPETNVGLIEELRNLFNRIISKRLKQAQAPRYPVEEGEELVDPAQLVADVNSGNLYPKVWEDTEIKEKKGERFGEVEITLVCDRSSSMSRGNKAEEQRKSAVLVMEVLKEFAELCESERVNMDKPLEVKSEIYSFASSDEDKIPMKKMSSELGEAERIKIFKKLYDLPGSTTDFICLGSIYRELDDDRKLKIKEGELKKIIIVFTDGISDNSDEVQKILSKLRSDGVIAVGIGITKEGQAVLNTYAPNALVVEDVKRLPMVLGELLKEHLKTI